MMKNSHDRPDGPRHRFIVDTDVRQHMLEQSAQRRGQQPGENDADERERRVDRPQLVAERD